MVKIVILTGSPHQGGTSHRLASAVEKGAKESGNDVYRYDAGLQGPTNPHFLQMDNSKSGEVGLPDNDFFERDVIPHLLKCDIIVFACSIYFFGMNAQLKVVLDRFYLYSNQLEIRR